MSVNIISLNQIVDLFSGFADRHYFLNDFGFGPTSEIGTSRQMDFPYMWVSLNDNSSINPQNKTAIPELSFSILFMDKTNIQSNYLNINGDDSNNIQEILSDTLQTLQDFVTEVQVDWGNYGIMFQDTINCFPATDETQDKVNGWVGQFTFKLKHSNCILPTGDITQTNLSPINPMTRYLTCDTLSLCPTIIDIENQLIGVSQTRLFSQTGDSIMVSATTVETTLIDGGVGSLSVPPNGFSIGDSFNCRMGGMISNQNNHTIRIKIKSGSIILGDSGVQMLSLHSNDNWDLDVDFTIRNIGSSGTASIMTLGDFHTTKKNSNDVIGFSFETLNNTTFDTTISNTLDITVEWGQVSNDDIIYSRVFVLQKTY